MPDDIGAEIVDLLSNPDGTFKLGDFEGNAEDFDKKFITQAALQEMREKDKAENANSNAAQVRAEVDRQQAQWLATQQTMQRAAQPQPQGNGFQGGLDSIYGAVNDQHQGYVHVDQLKQIIAHIVDASRAEFSARDRQNQALGKGLEQWHGQSQQRAHTLETLQGTHVDRVWGKFMDDMETEHSKIPRSVIESLSRGYSASDGETPDQIRAGIAEKLSEHTTAMNAHGEAGRRAKREASEQLAAVGPPGMAAAAVPSAPDKVLTSPEEIADHYGGDDLPAS